MMRRIILATLLIAISACSKPDPKQVVIPEDEAKWKSELEQNLQTLSEEDKTLLSQFFMRAKLGGAFGVEEAKITKGMTVGEAIENQKQFVASQKRKQELQNSENEKEAKANAEFQKKYELTFVGFEIAKIPGIGDGIDLKIALKNNSDKPISAVDGSILLRVDGIEQGTSLFIGSETFKPPIEPNSAGEITFLTDTDNIKMVKISQGNAVVQLQFEDVTVLHADGSTEILKQGV